MLLEQAGPSRVVLKFMLKVQIMWMNYGRNYLRMEKI